MAAPLGNKNAVKNRPWREALQRVLQQLEIKDKDGNVLVAQGEALRHIAETVVRSALAGDKDAYKEIACRLEGTADQNINLGADPSFTEAVPGLAAFMVEALRRQEAGDHQGMGEGGPLLSPEVPPTTH